jgi:hypothetical protein
MHKSIRIPAILALSLALTVPALAQSTHEQHAAPATAAKTAPAVDSNKADLLHQEYVAKTAELRGKLTAKQAELETLLATKPDDTAAIKKLSAEISTLRGSLLEQTALFRVRFAKETGTPIRMTRNLEHMGGMMGMMGMMGEKGMGMECMGKDKGMMMDMGKGMDMKGMDMGKGMKMDMDGKGMNMPAGAPKADDAAKTPTDKQ